MMPDSTRSNEVPSSRRPRPVPLAPAAASAPAFSVDVALRSDPGCVRDNNEDSLLVTSAGASPRAVPGAIRLIIEPPAFAVLGACDGMGGAAAGEVASRMAVEIIDEVMRRDGPSASIDELGRRVMRSLDEATRKIYARAQAQRVLCGMGTTATLGVLSGRTLLVAQIGDSRAYLLRRGRLTQLTRDQTLATLMVESGQLAPEDLASFPFNNVILQAVGATPRLDIDLRAATVCQGDVLLLCSDGLHGPVTDAEIEAVLARETSPSAACEALIARALHAGGPDNVSCIVARIEGAGLPLPDGDEVMVERAVLEPEESPPPTDRPDAVQADASGEERAGATPSLSPSWIERLRAALRRGSPA
ncbi:MAG: protein phosphatase 2C domain-containing protein [Byssovorax sp.]